MQTTDTTPTTPAGKGDWNLEDEGFHQMILLKGETTWNPASTNRRLAGPSLLVYRNWSDGSIDVHEYDLPRPGALLRYTGPEIPFDHAAGIMPVPAESEVKLVSWYAGKDPDGRPLVEVEWPHLPRVTFYLNRADVKVLQVWALS